MQFKDLVDSYGVSNFPHNLILVGEDGCGKHTLCDYIASHLQFISKDISNEVSLDILWEAQLNSEPIIYIIDLSYRLPKYQNELLKTLEDYSNINYFILLSENDCNILPTIVNRCVVWRYGQYTEQELESVSDSYRNIKLKNVFHTPGQVLKWCDPALIDEIQSFCNLIFDKIGGANISNILSISNKIGFGKKSDGYPLDLFKRVLYVTSYSRCLSNRDRVCYDVYCLTREYVNSTNSINIDQQRKFEQYLFKLKFLMKNGNI